MRCATFARISRLDALDGRPTRVRLTPADNHFRPVRYAGSANPSPPVLAAYQHSEPGTE